MTADINTLSEPSAGDALYELSHKYGNPDGGRGWLIHDIVDTAIWRIGKADEYPDDDRNLPAARHLAKVAAELDARTDDDPEIAALDDAWDAIDTTKGELFPSFSDILRSYGFSWGGRQYYPDTADVLARCVHEIESCTQLDRQYREYDARVMSRKLAAAAADITSTLVGCVVADIGSVAIELIESG